MPLKKLAIISTHPIQYYAPVFRLLSERGKVEIKVFYTWGEGSLKKHDPGFGKTIEWDIPLLEGYNYEFLTNTSAEPGSHHFKGIKNPDLISKVKSFNPDAILVYGWAYQSHLKLMRHFKGKIPVWFRGDSTLLNFPRGYIEKAKAIIKKIFLKWVYQHIDKAFFVGSNNKAYFLKYGLTEHQLVFAPHAIDNNRFQKDRSEEALNFRQELKLIDTDILILFAGKLDNNKNPFLLLKAFIDLKISGAYLLFTGNGILKKDLELKALAQPNIHFCDFQNQSILPVHYQACDLFCLPSLSETWGLAVNEAMTCGKAVLVSDKVGCAIDLVKQNLNGAIFKSNSYIDIHQKLGDLIKKKRTDLQLMGQASLHIIQDWTFQNQVKAIENCLSKIA